jgi:glucose/arabinose dehydrogenase
MMKRKVACSMKKFSFHFILTFSFLCLAGCYRMRTSKGGGQSQNTEFRKIKLADIAVPAGYKIEMLADGFTFPSAVTFDAQGTPYVLETGYAYGEVWLEPKLIKIQGTTKTVVAKGDRNGPWTGVDYSEGYFYVSEGGEADGGKIIRVSPAGEMKTIVEGLPSVGDHHTNVPVVKDGYIYFGQGTATNSGVVGEDNADFGWLKRKQDFHDTPCGDIMLTGENFESMNVLTENPDDKISTGAYAPFGKPTSPGEVIKGSVPCNGAIMRVPVAGGKLEVVSWGLRNPFGLAVAPNGKFYTTENAYDERGSRPIWGAGDVLWEVKENMWYGWPDFSAGKPIKNDEEFKSPTRKEIKPLLQKYPNTPPAPVAVFGVHSSSNGFDFSKSDAFGFKGEAFVAQFGDMAPNVGKVLAPVGFKVVRVNVDNGVIRDFAINKGKRNGPATWLKKAGLERPISVKFSPDGKALYIVDFGILKMTDEGPQPQTNTGVVWRVVKK